MKMSLKTALGVLLIAQLISLQASAQQAAPVLRSTPVQGKLAYMPGTNFCEAIIVPAQSTAYLSGQVGGNSTDFRTQVRRSLSGLNTTLTSLGSSMNAVVKSTVYLTNLDYFQDMNSVYITYFTPGTLPARSTVEVAGLAGMTSIEIDFIAVDPIFATMRASS